MANDWQAQQLGVGYDGRQVGMVACEIKRHRTFGFSPRLKAEVRCVLDFTGLATDVPRPTRASSFTLSSSAGLFGQKEGWHVKEMRDDGDANHERLWLLLETG